MPPPGPKPKHRRPVGAGLSLDKFAEAGVSKFDKRKKLEKLQKEKLIQRSKYSKLKRKLEAQGVLSGFNVKDSVAELEALDAREAAKSSEGEQEDDSPEQQQRQPKRQRTEQVHKPGRGAAPRAHQQEMLGGAEEEGPSGSGGEDEGGRGSGRGWSGDNGQRESAAGSKAGKGSRPDGSQSTPDGGGAGARRGKAAGPKKPSQLHRLAMKVAEEKEAAQRAKEEAMRQKEERQKRIAEVEKHRKEEKHLYFKRTAKGQPLMRYRMDKLLAKIQQS